MEKSMQELNETNNEISGNITLLEKLEKIEEKNNALLEDVKAQNLLNNEQIELLSYNIELLKDCKIYFKELENSKKEILKETDELKKEVTDELNELKAIMMSLLLI